MKGNSTDWFSFWDFCADSQLPWNLTDVMAPWGWILIRFCSTENLRTAEQVSNTFTSNPTFKQESHQKTRLFWSFMSRNSRSLTVSWLYWSDTNCFPLFSVPRLPWQQALAITAKAGELFENWVRLCSPSVDLLGVCQAGQLSGKLYWLSCVL